MKTADVILPLKFIVCVMEEMAVRVIFNVILTLTKDVTAIHLLICCVFVMEKDLVYFNAILRRMKIAFVILKLIEVARAMVKLVRVI